MARCRNCTSNRAPMDGGLCPICQEKVNNQARSSAKTPANNYYNPNRIEKMTADADGNITEYRANGKKITRSKKEVNHRFRNMVIVFLLVIVAGFFGFRYYKYNDTENGLYKHYEITEAASGDSAAFASAILTRNEGYEGWEISVIERPAGYFISIFRFSDKSAFVRYWVEDGSAVYFYKFDGKDMGTGLSGRYYLATVNGKLSLIDQSAKTIYPQGTSFFDEHYEALSAFTYGNIIPELMSKVKGGEYGCNTDFNTTILKADKYSVCVYDERYETRILDESGDMRLQYAISYYTENTYHLPDLSGYQTAE